MSLSYKIEFEEGFKCACCWHIINKEALYCEHCGCPFSDIMFSDIDPTEKI